MSICVSRELNRLSSVSLGDNILWACMLNQKQFGRLKFLSVNFNETLKSKNIFCLQSKNFPPDKRHPGHRSRYGKYGPRSGYGFLRTACQPIRIENIEKPYNNLLYRFYIFNKYKTFSVLIYSHINTSGNWENDIYKHFSLIPFFRRRLSFLGRRGGGGGGGGGGG
jgi:hypothetical protein